MRKNIFTCIILFSVGFVYGQEEGFKIIPEVGYAFPNNNSDLKNISATGGLHAGVNAEKWWGKFGLGLYGGVERNEVKYEDFLPSSNAELSISRSSEKIQDYSQQFQFGLGPVFELAVSKKFDLDISSKFGFSKISYPEFTEFVDVGDPLNQQYTLYQTMNEEVDGSVRPMLLSSLRLNYEISKRFALTFSTSYKHVRNVEHAYEYLGGNFNPEMTNAELIEELENPPTINETWKCHFNSIGIGVGIGYTFIPKDKETPKPDTINQEVPDSCLSSLIRNEGFIKRLGRNSVAPYWSAGYGAPKFLKTPGVGFLDPGYAEVSGNQTTGSAISQVLDPNNKFILGRNYVLTVGVRFQQGFNTLNYAKIRAIAYNGSLPTTGAHPGPDQNIAIIGRSGKIKDCGDWSFIEFPVWKANKNFDKIAINVFTNDGTSSILWIDNVTVCEVSEGYGCDSIQLNASGEPIIPPGYGSVLPGFTCYPEAEDEEYYNGTLQDLYGQLYGYDGTTNWYANASDPCFSIGGTLPIEVLKYNCDDSLKMAGINMTCEEFEKLLTDPDIPKPNTKSVYLKPLGPLQDNCDSQPIIEPDHTAFQGKDIIYIHGLQLSHLGARASFKKGADANWPDDPYEFYDGYYKKVAEKNWKPHIDYFLRGKNNRNRYLIVTYNCSQRADVAVHTVLAQIREAMENGKGVEFDPSDVRGKSCFAREYIIISTSTGSLVGDVALSIANKTKTNTTLRSEYGNIGLISDRCKGHMAVRGALSGSNLASLILSTQMPSAVVQKVIDILTDGEYQIDFSTGPNKDLLLGSVLYDLVPEINRVLWGNYINDVSVPVITISSGHPTAILGSFKFIVHPGFDDGVLSMDCSSARICPSSMIPSQYIASSIVKAYDMGIPPIRAISYFLDQKFPPGGFAFASTPYLSLTGMVQPVASVLPFQQFNNHFNFVQSPAEHVLPKNSFLKNPYFECNYWRTHLAGPNNYEEVLAVSDASLYSSGIVSPTIISQMSESVKGLIIYYPAIKIRYKRGIPFPVIYWKEFYIWKRTYHKLIDNCMYDCDYGYKYLFKN